MSKMDLLYQVVNALITVSLEPPAEVTDADNRVESPKDLLWKARFAEVLRKAMATKILVQVSYPKRLSKGLIIPACDGTETLAKAKKVFKGCIDRNFEKWGTNIPGVATAEVKVDAHRMSNGSSYAGIFGSFGSDMDKLCFTQHQIQAFCQKYHVALLSPQTLVDDPAHRIAQGVKDRVCRRPASHGAYVSSNSHTWQAWSVGV